MGKRDDFSSSFDYDGFFSKLSSRIGKTEYSNEGQHCCLTIPYSGHEIKIENEPFDGIRISSSIEMANAKEFCFENNGRYGHVVFNAQEDNVRIYVVMPLSLGSGWDDLIIEETVAGLDEVKSFLSENT